MGWLSINFYGSSKGKPDPAGATGVIRNHRGQIILLITESLGIQTSHFVEAWVAYINLSLLRRLNYNNIILGGDSLNVVNMLQGLIPPRWDIKSMVEDARRILKGIENLFINHNFREANFVANQLADEAVGLLERRVWERDLSEHLMALAIEDSLDR